MDIRKKGTVVSPVIVNDNIKAAVESLKMQPIETVPFSQYKVPDSPVRSPAPFPQPVSPAGIPVNVEESTGMVDLNIFHDLDLDDVDLTVEGKAQEGEYRRNVRGTLVVGTMVLVSLHLFSEHCNMFTWVVRFETPQTVIAAILYIISTLCMLAVFGCALVKPSFSISRDKLMYYYSPILVAGVMDLIAIAIAGSIFSPFILFTLDSMSYITYNEVAAVLTVILNAGLFFAMTRGNDTIISDWFHPFKSTARDSIEEGVVLEEVITVSEKDNELEG